MASKARSFVRLIGILSLSFAAIALIFHYGGLHHLQPSQAADAIKVIRTDARAYGAAVMRQPFDQLQKTSNPGANDVVRPATESGMAAPIRPSLWAPLAWMAQQGEDKAMSGPRDKCSNAFGMGYIKAWKGKREIICHPRGGPAISSIIAYPMVSRCLLRQTAGQ